MLRQRCLLRWRKSIRPASVRDHEPESRSRSEAFRMSFFRTRSLIWNSESINASTRSFVQLSIDSIASIVNDCICDSKSLGNSRIPKRSSHGARERPYNVSYFVFGKSEEICLRDHMLPSMNARYSNQGGGATSQASEICCLASIGLSRSVPQNNAARSDAGYAGELRQEQPLLTCDFEDL